MTGMQRRRAGLMLLAALLISSVHASSGGLWAAEAVQIAKGRDGSAPKQPQMVVDEKGRVHLVYGAGNDVWYCRSDDGGETFSSPQRAFEVPNLSLGMRRGPRIAIAGETLVVSAIGGPQGKGRDGDLLTWRSVDNGATWQGPVTVNSVKDSAREGLHAMTSDDSGTVWCVWLDLRNNQTELYAALSRNGGAAWEQDRCLYQSPDGNICECCHPSVVAHGNQVHILFRNAVDGSRDMYVVSSTDHGTTFSEARKLGQGTWKLKACPMDGGMLAVDRSGSLHAVWRREEKIFRTSNSGSAEEFLGEGEQPWITSTSKGVSIAWTAKRNGALYVLPPGASSPSQLAAIASDPVVCSGPKGMNSVLVCWESSVGGESSVLVARVEP